ncbi:MAG: HAMP domain-containing sensor histidine kinase, partial [Actinomycetota bacterium]
MSLRTRIAALTAGAVAIAVLLVAAGSWVLVRRELRGQVDDGLVRRMAQVRGPGRIFDERLAPGPRGRNDPFGLDNAIQVIDSSGEVLIAPGPAMLPVADRDRAVAARTDRAYLHDERVGENHLRVLTAPAGADHAVMMARDLSEVDGALRGFAIISIILAALGIGGAAVAGLVVARRAIAPVERLTKAAEHVAETKRLDAAIEVDSTDELGRLGTSFNQMLSALSESREQQRRLVHDASHELRTPLTSLRTNVDVLARQADMSEEDRKRVLADLQSELGELSALVGEIVALATEAKDENDEEVVDVGLGDVALAVVDRAKRRSGREIVLDSDGSIVAGRPNAIERAISNLVENATKWGPEGEPVEITVAEGRVSVRDRGPGISDADKPHVFDRFYRATAARS